MKPSNSLFYKLSDENRNKILTKLSESNLTFSELIEKTGIANTGTLNYHIRILGDLILKNEEGKYMLTEKGRLASKLLTEFPEDTIELSKQWVKINFRTKTPNYGYWVIIAWVLALIAFVFLVASNNISINTLVFPWLLFFTGIIYFVMHIRLSKKTKGCC